MRFDVQPIIIQDVQRDITVFCVLTDGVTNYCILFSGRITGGCSRVSGWRTGPTTDPTWGTGKCVMVASSKIREHIMATLWHANSFRIVVPMLCEFSSLRWFSLKKEQSCGHFMIFVASLYTLLNTMMLRWLQCNVFESSPLCQAISLYLSPETNKKNHPIAHALGRYTGCLLV